MTVVTAHPIIDSVLDRHRTDLGQHLAAYRNHVYRLNYHQILLDAPAPDAVALAWAVHDLGIWTAGSFDYLGPSIELAAAYADQYGITDLERVQAIVTHHHKLRRLPDQMAESFRIADMIDVSRGLLSRGVGHSHVKAVVAQIPYCGFHTFLARGLIRHASRHPARPLPMLRW